MNSIYQLFLINWKIFYRNFLGFFWTIAIPVVMYSGLSFVPVQKLIGDTGFSYSSFLLPGLIAMALMQGGIYGLAYWLVDLRARGVLKRFTVTPMSRGQFVAGVLLSRILVMLIQVIILTSVGILFFSAVFNFSVLNLLSILLFVLIGGSVFLLFGLFIATIATTYESAAPITAAFGLSMTFLGNVFYPTSIMPETLQWFSKLLPMTYFSDGLRTLYLHPAAWATISTDLIAIVIWLIISIVLVAWRFRLEA